MANRGARFRDHRNSITAGICNANKYLQRSKSRCMVVGGGVRSPNGGGSGIPCKHNCYERSRCSYGRVTAADNVAARGRYRGPLPLRSQPHGRSSPSELIPHIAPFLRAASAITDAEAYYAESVDAGVQQQCLACHQQNGAAAQSGARLILSQLTQDNHAAFSSLLAEEGVDTALILEKVTGGEGHGGGAVLPAGSALFLSLQHYLELLEDGSPQSEEGPIDFGRALHQNHVRSLCGERRYCCREKLRGTRRFSARRRMIRRSGKRFSPSCKERVSKGFLVTGANDRLLISGLENGIDFNISTFDRYPEPRRIAHEAPGREARGVRGLP